ncbi:MAG: tail fiber domain-containing protein [Caulobacterales bacterium]
MGIVSLGPAFAATGTINTSDAREKTTLAAIPDGFKRAVRRVIACVGVFQWLEAVERKGVGNARRHVGVTAHDVRDAFAAEGVDASRWAPFCEDAVMERVEIEPARIERSAISDPETGEEHEIETPIPARFEECPKRDANGAPITRLGVRADQLMWLAIAAAAVAG